MSYICIFRSLTLDLPPFNALALRWYFGIVSLSCDLPLRFYVPTSRKRKALWKWFNNRDFTCQTKYRKLKFDSQRRTIFSMASHPRSWLIVTTTPFWALLMPSGGDSAVISSINQIRLILNKIYSPKRPFNDCCESSFTTPFNLIQPKKKLIFFSVDSGASGREELHMHLIQLGEVGMQMVSARNLHRYGV